MALIEYSFNELTIVSITYNNPSINKTITSIETLLDFGAKGIIQNGGSTLNGLKKPNLTIYNEDDDGLYDALNKGISKVKTKYFMLIHAGDEFIGTINDLDYCLNTLGNSDKGCALNSQRIGRRLHSSKTFYSWMLNIGVQPPHLPTIYKTQFYGTIAYDLSIPIIADFNFYYENLQSFNYIKTNKLLIQMEPGGLTSSGLSSFIRVSKEFINTYGIKGYIMSLFRVPFKILQSIL